MRRMWKEWVAWWLAFACCAADHEKVEALEMAFCLNQGLDALAGCSALFFLHSLCKLLLHDDCTTACLRLSSGIEELDC